MENLTKTNIEMEKFLFFFLVFCSKMEDFFDKEEINSNKIPSKDIDVYICISVLKE